ncbi:hypothetical protein [Pinisolibacter aquiterrae]|uniref:hypothetical protein n=1 Tax=Pinisolibacter aquiterrae TaxID=2815579 RepID=UPI001C3E6B35|nr:hypothetical protein [Pinisolibacter aquiterrae]MBV5263894.1 hypothetical protein [Pinisolibacter aquiterrae]MCC8234591.1 hypothetical protein [Pinisolibacter aquiterrae]
MQPILLSRFRELLLLRGETAKLAPETLLASNGRDELFYVPFEYVNRSARLVIVGITPGPNQIAEAYKAVRAQLRVGADEDTVLRETKRIGSFGSPTMRPNLVKMLDAMGFSELLGLRSSAALWEEAFVVNVRWKASPRRSARASTRGVAGFWYQRTLLD